MRPSPDWTSSATNSTPARVHSSRTSARYVGGGTITPASPCTGSSSTATVCLSIAAASAALSPNGTTRKPGANGPKPPRASGSVEKPTIVVVRPWKLSAATTMLARPSGTPLTS